MRIFDIEIKSEYFRVKRSWYLNNKLQLARQFSYYFTRILAFRSCSVLIDIIDFSSIVIVCIIVNKYIIILCSSSRLAQYVDQEFFNIKYVSQNWLIQRLIQLTNSIITMKKAEFFDSFAFLFNVNFFISFTRDKRERKLDSQNKRKIEEKLSIDLNTKKSRAKLKKFTKQKKKLKNVKNVDRQFVKYYIRKFRDISSYKQINANEKTKMKKSETRWIIDKR